ncbi:MAG: carboxypeptidase regulatory-like domain-containing protein [Thaumarchaeota archaeon]|nr:carboxypeptidase regulatory-like domain-containing protein [Nitrososphaerota archaeon]
MKRIHVATPAALVIVAFIISFSNIQDSHSVLTYSMLVSVKPQQDPIMQGGYPVIVGNVTDQAYKPVADANVFILFGSEAVTTTTDNQGQFKYTSAIPATPGTYEIDVTVTKPGYIKQLASSVYTVNPYPTTKATSANTTTSITNTISGLPVFAGNYTVYLGKVTQWNLETTCFVDFGNKYMRFLKTCDLYNLDPQDFVIDQQIIPMVTVIQYNGTYRLFPDHVYNEAYYLGNDTAAGFAASTWQSYVAPK